MAGILKKLYQRLPIIRELRAIHQTLGAIHSAAALSSTVNAVRLFDLELKKHPRYGSPRRLTQFEKSINSQNGEDGIIQEIFARIGIKDQTFVEIGVADGIECNTSFLLASGWRGYWIDGTARFQPNIERREDLRSSLQTLRAFVTRENVSELFQELKVPTEFDLLSLDIDQNTYHIWQGLKGYKPRAVVVEYNAVVPPGEEWSVSYSPERMWDGTNNYAASLKSYELLGRQLGYSLVGCDFNGVNAFFVRNDLVGDKFEAPFTSENHYEPPRFALAGFRRGHTPAILDRSTARGT